MKNNPKEKIQKIIDLFGISVKIQSKAMNVSVQTIYNKSNDKVQGHSFNEKNYQDFKTYLINRIKDL